MKKLITFVLMLLPIMALAQNHPQDWAQFGRYAEANSALTEKPFAVLYGDSITDSWPKTHPDFFKENNLAGRGISGQTTSQILVRMQQDVVSLAPKYVVILCGINDIAMLRISSRCSEASGQCARSPRQTKFARFSVHCSRPINSAGDRK